MQGLCREIWPKGAMTVVIVEPRGCSRCGQPFQAEQRIVDDPCCGAPDCDGLAWQSHYTFLPAALREIEDEY